MLIAPTFIWEGGLKEKFVAIPMGAVGFKAYSKWSMDTYLDFFRQNGWGIVDYRIIPSSFSIAFVVVKRQV